MPILHPVSNVWLGAPAIALGCIVGFYTIYYRKGEMSIFMSTRSTTTKTSLPSSVDRASAISFLHDHVAFQNLQPLLVDNKVVESLPSNEWLITEASAVSPHDMKPEYRDVTVRVPFGFLSNDITTTTALVDNEDGLTLIYQAPMGLYGKDQWKIVPADDEDGLVLVEASIMTGFALLMPFVLTTKKRSHTEIGEKFAKRLAEAK